MPRGFDCAAIELATCTEQGKWLAGCPSAVQGPEVNEVMTSEVIQHLGRCLAEVRVDDDIQCPKRLQECFLSSVEAVRPAPDDEELCKSTLAACDRANVARDYDQEDCAQFVGAFRPGPGRDRVVKGLGPESPAFRCSVQSVWWPPVPPVQNTNRARNY